MNYKTILVHIDSGKHSEKRLEATIRLARQYDACLVGLYAFSPYIPPGYIMAHMGEEITAAQNKIAVESMSRAEEVFKKQTSSAGLEKSEWLTVFDDPVNAMTLQARYADIVVISQSDSSDDSGVAMDFPERLVLAAGRPVLILPNRGDFPCIGTRILVAWNDSQEASRAVSSSIPLLRSASRVFVVTVNSKASKNNSIPNENIIHYLGRLGVRAELKESYSVEIDVGNELLSRASGLDVDLIVMGCYGHSRLREWVLGGATRTILDSMTIPVLMAH
jgi:nucleotide-binding universal stress UspA family protein